MIFRRHYATLPLHVHRHAEKQCVAVRSVLVWNTAKLFYARLLKFALRMPIRLSHGLHNSRQTFIVRINICYNIQNCVILRSKCQRSRSCGDTSLAVACGLSLRNRFINSSASVDLQFVKIYVGLQNKVFDQIHCQSIQCMHSYKVP